MLEHCLNHSGDRFNHRDDDDEDDEDDDDLGRAYQSVKFRINH